MKIIFIRWLAYGLWILAFVSMAFVNAIELEKVKSTYAVISTIILNALLFTHLMRKINEKL